MARIMKSRDGKYYELRNCTYSNGIGVETDIYNETGGWSDEYCIDEVYCGRALLTCGNTPVCWLPEEEQYYEKRKNRVRPIVSLCKWMLKRKITNAVQLMEITGMKQGQRFSGGCEVPYLKEVPAKEIVLKERS